MEIKDSSEKLEDNPLELPKPTENTVNQQSTDSVVEQSEINPSDTPEPKYLSFLRFFAGLNLVVGVLAFFGFLCKVSDAIKGSSKEADFGWMIALAITLEGLIAYGLLNAIADIAENMIDVGNYVRELRRQNKS